MRSDAAAWRVLDLLPRRLGLTGPVVASGLEIPLKSANAALGDSSRPASLSSTAPCRAVGADDRVAHYTSAELLGLTGSNPLPL